LTWGNHEAIVAMTEKMARRDGFGDILADGVKVAAERIGKGSAQYAIHVGGQELPMHDPRFEPGLGLIYKLDATPGRHTQANQYAKPVDLDYAMPNYGENPAEQKGRGRHLRVVSALNHVLQASGLCQFGYCSTRAPFTFEFLSAITGHEYTIEESLVVGDRIAVIRHAFNLREGINPLALPVPRRAYGYPPLPDGPTAGIGVELEMMEAEYLEVMDWDPVTAMPSVAKLEQLGLGFIAESLPRS
jgi:aldehyde:ferredoxin oxidoreductase